MQVAYNLQQAATAIGVGRTTLYRARKLGILGEVDFAGKRLILREDLERVMRRLRRQRGGRQDTHV